MSSFLKKLTGVDFGEVENESFEEEVGFDVNEIIDADINIEIPIDVYQDEKFVYFRAFIPAIKPENLEINLTRDVVEIIGERKDESRIENENFHQRELSWGKFEKKVLLPHEIEVDKVKATNENGVLVLKMPKLDKDRSVKISLN